jgi:hypothetical protein
MTEPVTTQWQQMCNIAIMFIVTSDEEAILIKKKLEDALIDSPNVRMDFRIVKIPTT